MGERRVVDWSRWDRYRGLETTEIAAHVAILPGVELCGRTADAKWDEVMAGLDGSGLESRACESGRLDAEEVRHRDGL